MLAMLSVAPPQASATAPPHPPASGAATAASATGRGKRPARRRRSAVMVCCRMPSRGRKHHSNALVCSVPGQRARGLRETVRGVRERRRGKPTASRGLHVGNAADGGFGVPITSVRPDCGIASHLPSGNALVCAGAHSSPRRHALRLNQASGQQAALTRTGDNVRDPRHPFSRNHDVGMHVTVDVALLAAHGRRTDLMASFAQTPSMGRGCPAKTTRKNTDPHKFRASLRNSIQFGVW